MPLLRPDRVTYSPGLPAGARLVDPYSIAVIEKALDLAKMTAAGAIFDERDLTAAFKTLKASGHIHELIDETKKTNMCWHLEIKPNVRSL